MRLGMVLALLLMMMVFLVPAWAGMEEGEAAYARGDYAAAVRECQPLAEEGNPAAQLLLGKMYLEGRGVPRDTVQAEIWFILAAASGNRTAETLRNYVARDYLTDAQIGKAAREAWRWKPKQQRMRTVSLLRGEAEVTHRGHDCVPGDDDEPINHLRRPYWARHCHTFFMPCAGKCPPNRSATREKALRGADESWSGSRHGTAGRPQRQ